MLILSYFYLLRSGISAFIPFGALSAAQGMVISMKLQTEFDRLIQAVGGLDGVVAVGKSGSARLPEPGEGDIDLFVFCDAVPPTEVRRNALKALGGNASECRVGESGGRFWGVCDFAELAGVELCLMYFTVADMDRELAEVLAGARPDREAEYFYPTGRCASLLSMHVLRDGRGYLAAKQAALSNYPPELAETLAAHHLAQIDDEEDFERAVARSDVLFYHSTLESALDHYLQALFALNRRYFPSRKRTPQLIGDFARQPVHCAERLLEVVALGARADTLAQSYKAWRGLCGELVVLAGRA